MPKPKATAKEKKGGYFHQEPEGVAVNDFTNMNLSRQFLKAPAEFNPDHKTRT